MTVRVIDIETTGTNPEADAVIEIASVDVQADGTITNEVGRLLIKARESLREQRGAWSRLIGDGFRSQLPFSATMAKALIAIAADSRIRHHGDEMPPSWRTLYEISQLDDAEFNEALAEGRIHPEMKRADVKKTPRETPGEERTAPHQASSPTEDYLTPDEADKAVRETAAYVRGVFLDPPPGVRACVTISARMHEGAGPAG